MSAENQWLEGVFPMEMVSFQGTFVHFRGGICNGFISYSWCRITPPHTAINNVCRYMLHRHTIILYIQVVSVILVFSHVYSVWTISNDLRLAQMKPLKLSEILHRLDWWRATST